MTCSGFSRTPPSFDLVRARYEARGYTSVAPRGPSGVFGVERPTAYERHVIPTPGRIFFQALLGIGIGVNYRNPDRAPLLLVA